MMRCNQVQEVLSAFYDHELSEPIAEDVRQHIRLCEDCHGKLNEFRALSLAAEQLAGHLAQVDIAAAEQRAQLVAVKICVVPAFLQTLGTEVPVDRGKV